MRRIISNLISVICFIISVIPLFLPWSARKMYLQLLEKVATVSLKSKLILHLVSKRAFSEEAEFSLLSKEE